MSTLWSYFWPVIAAGIAAGALAATYGFRRRRLRAALTIGGLLAIGLAGLWHGPLGGADRFIAAVDRGIQRTFVYYEIPQVRGQLQRGPLARQVHLSGKADDFQRAELVRLIGEVPGVARASWSKTTGVPLIVEAALAALLGFLLGLLMAYLVEIRRRYNAQYNW